MYNYVISIYKCKCGNKACIIDSYSGKVYCWTCATDNMKVEAELAYLELISAEKDTVIYYKNRTEIVRRIYDKTDKTSKTEQ